MSYLVHKGINKSVTFCMSYIVHKGINKRYYLFTHLTTELRIYSIITNQNSRQRSNMSIITWSRIVTTEIDLMLVSHLMHTIPKAPFFYDTYICSLHLTRQSSFFSYFGPFLMTLCPVDEKRVTIFIHIDITHSTRRIEAFHKLILFLVSTLEPLLLVGSCYQQFGKTIQFFCFLLHEFSQSH